MEKPASRPNIRLDSTRGQFIMVLLAALADLSDRIPTKREVERHIEKRGYLTLPREFLERAYESKAEPMWKTELAWARKDAKDRGLLNPTAKDEWEISEKSTAKFAFIERDFQSGKLESSRFPLLSTKFFERVGAVK